MENRTVFKQLVRFFGGRIFGAKNQKNPNNTYENKKIA